MHPPRDWSQWNPSSGPRPLLQEGLTQATSTSVDDSGLPVNTVCTEQEVPGREGGRQSSLGALGSVGSRGRGGAQATTSEVDSGNCCHVCMTARCGSRSEAGPRPGATAPEQAPSHATFFLSSREQPRACSTRPSPRSERADVMRVRMRVRVRVRRRRRRRRRRKRRREGREEGRRGRKARG
eukprot:169236-Rhodomonas_salina.1